MSIPVYIFKRALQAIPLLILISIMSFTMLKVAPVDPLAHLKANPAISQKAIREEEERLGLNKPPQIQYLIWLTNVLKGDLGISPSGGSVFELLKQRAGNTLMLSVISIACTWLIAIPAGTYAAIHRGEFLDKTFGLVTAMGMSMPTFLSSLLLMMFALYTGWLPVGGLTSSNFFEMGPFQKFLDLAHHLVIPVTVLTFYSLAGIQRQMRGSLLDVLRKEYVRTARAKGLSENVVIYKHAVRNAINPLITLFGLEFASLLSGAALAEMVLAYPGLGRLALDGVLTKDINLVMASIMIGALMLILGNLVADILLKVTDPRITLEG